MMGRNPTLGISSQASRLGTQSVSRIATDLSADYPAGTTLMGRFAVEPTMLHTGLLLNADAACDTTG